MQLYPNENHECRCNEKRDEAEDKTFASLSKNMTRLTLRWNCPMHGQMETQYDIIG